MDSTDDNFQDPEFADHVRDVFRQVWDEFYAWEGQYCQKAISDLMKPVKATQPIRRSGNIAELSNTQEDALANDSTSDKDDAEYLTVTSFTDPGTRHLRFEDAEINKNQIPEPYSAYESCAPISRSLYVGDDPEILPFVPFADDPTFNNLEHIAQYKHFKWQKWNLDPDVEYVVLETAGRLAKVHWCGIPVEFSHIDQTGVFKPMSLVGTEGFVVGLLHVALQRDYAPWPDAHLQDFLHGRDHVRPRADDVHERLKGVDQIYCPVVSCVNSFCLTHVEPTPVRAPKMSTQTLQDIIRSIKTPCSETCCSLLQKPTGGLTHWPKHAREELRVFLTIEPDWLPCDLATIIQRPCIEISMMRAAVLPLITLPQLHPRTRRSKPAKPKFHDKESEKYTPCSPCTHAGPCIGSNCPCYMNKGHCERNCHCESNCIRRFEGCKCALTALEKLCRTKRCMCFRVGRECDPELCLPCEARNADANLCQNCPIQRGNRKNSVVRMSNFGLGLYLTEPAESDDLLMEYVGEIILPATMTSRDDLARHRKRNYVFDLNSTYVIDAGQAGNPSRYINHAPMDEANCKAYVHLVNGEHRIGLLATKSIEAGQELFLFYGTEFFERM